MLYVLLFIGLNQTPAQLGIYNNIHECESAIRKIYEAKFTPRGIELTKDLQENIKFVVDNKLKYQKDYICQSKN